MTSKTVKLPPHIARVILRRRASAGLSQCLGDSFRSPAEKLLALAAGPEETLPAELLVVRGARIASTIVPRNMLANLRASEAKAWEHSDLAGALWEHGFRASIACQLAETA